MFKHDWGEDFKINDPAIYIYDNIKIIPEKEFEIVGAVVKI
jgi:hypothetical protein